jgi:nucleoside-diphosphate-sugar epimerase
MNSTVRHVVFGTGAIGRATLDALLGRGETVRMVNRSGSARVPEEVEVVGGDAADPQFTIEVTRGARVVYQTLKPPYERWVEEFPALQAGVLAAAEAQGARLVSMENVYMYGRPAGRPPTETRDYAAHAKKGKLRGQMATELLAAHQAGRVAVGIGRASDYFGPGGGAQSNLGDRLFPAALAGKTATVLGDPDQPHTYTYIPDIGEGLAVRGEHPHALGQVWHLPNDSNTPGSGPRSRRLHHQTSRGSARHVECRFGPSTNDRDHQSCWTRKLLLGSIRARPRSRAEPSARLYRGRRDHLDRVHARAVTGGCRADPAVRTRLSRPA